MQKNEWIPITDSLPSIEKLVLISYVGEDEDEKAKMFIGVGYVQSITQFKNKKIAAWYNDDDNPAEPSYWMHLPEPPPIPNKI